MSEQTVEELQTIAEQEALEAELAQKQLEEAIEAARIQEEQRIAALRVRLSLVSKNNCAYIEAFGHEVHWSRLHKSISEDTENLEANVEKLERAYLEVIGTDMTQAEDKHLTKLSLESKLEALGLTLEEIRSL